MAIAFMAILAGAIGERVERQSRRHSAVAAACDRSVQPVVVVVDRRLAALWLGAVFPCLALPLMFLLLPPKYTGTWYWIVAAALYALAKVLEHFDYAIYAMGHFVSGHSLKHLAAAAACYAILRHFQTRRAIA
jgi:hypothetical protein